MSLFEGDDAEVARWLDGGSARPDGNLIGISNAVAES